MTLKKLATRLALVTAVAALPNISSAAVPHTFAAGDPIRASEVNDNNNNLDQRLSRIESSTTQTVAVDCSGDANALKNITLMKYTTYVLTGMCNGPIEILDGNITIEGDATGIKDDGIILQAGLSSNPFAAIGIYGMNGNTKVVLDNLTIEATNYTDNFNTWSVSGINAGHGVHVRLYDIDINGGYKGVNAFNNSFVRMYSNIEIINFGKTGIDSSKNSTVDIREFILVEGKQTSVETNGKGINASEGGNIRLRNGGVITAPLGTNMTNPGSDQRAIQASQVGSIEATIGSGASFDITGRVVAFGSSSVRVDGAQINGEVKSRGSSNVSLTNVQALLQVRAEQSGNVDLFGGTVVTGRLRIKSGSSAYVDSSTLNGGVDSVQSSGIEMDNATVSGNLEISGGSSIVFYNSNVSSGYQHAYKSGTIEYHDTNVTLLASENLWAQDASRITFNGTTSIITADPIHAGLYSTLHLNGGNFNGAVVECISGNINDQIIVIGPGVANFTYDINCT